MQVIKYVLITILAVVIMVFNVTILPWLLIFIGLSMEPNPPGPEIKYAEFPLKLEYEINGEKKTIEDTLIVEFFGFGMNEGVGKYREWKSSYLSGNKDLIIHYIDENKKIELVYIDEEYFMGDPLSRSTNINPRTFWNVTEGNITGGELIEQDELFEEYGIKILNFEIEKPIKNTFK